jgi:hypothetical protein
MARDQTKSGGFILDNTIAYPVYITISHETSEVSAILNTGPASDAPLPDGYDGWIDGPHALFVMDGSSAVVRTKTPTVSAVFVPAPGGPSERSREGSMMALGRWMNN